MGDTSEAPRGLVGVGGSAGGVPAITELVANLPYDLPFAVMVVVHMPAAAPSVLARIVNRAGPLPAVTASSPAPRRKYAHRVVLADGPPHIEVCSIATMPGAAIAAMHNDKPLTTVLRTEVAPG